MEKEEGGRNKRVIDSTILYYTKYMSHEINHGISTMYMHMYAINSCAMYNVHGQNYNVTATMPWNSVKLTLSRKSVV